MNTVDHFVAARRDLGRAIRTAIKKDVLRVVAFFFGPFHVGIRSIGKDRIEIKIPFMKSTIIAEGKDLHFEIKTGKNPGTPSQ